MCTANGHRTLWIISAIAVVFAWSGVVSFTYAQEDPARPEDSTVRELTIPLDDGDLDVGELLGQLCDVVGIDGDPVRQKITWRINVHSTLGGKPVELIESATSDVIQIEIRDDVVALRYDEAEMQRERERIREDLQGLIGKWFPDAVESVNGSFGFHFYTPEAGRVDADEITFDAESRTHGLDCVVLIHGLNEPGHIWNELRPALLKNDLVVAEFWYPNDQGIAESTSFFAEEMQTLSEHGVEQTSIVAHSMGGLVARDFLTTPEEGDRPKVQRLIMVGTPNNGAALASLHFGGEIREQILRTFRGDGSIFGGLFDGSGEARHDLDPESEFLRNLNARPMPDDVDMTIIAGKASPWTREEIQSLREDLAVYEPTIASEVIDKLSASLADLTDDVGDGCVSVESTRMEGVADHVIVEGNHLTMLRNDVFQTDDRVPPVVPLILDRLMEEESDSDDG